MRLVLLCQYWSLLSVISTSPASDSDAHASLITSACIFNNTLPTVSSRSPPICEGRLDLDTGGGQWRWGIYSNGDGHKEGLQGKKKMHVDEFFSQLQLPAAVSQRVLNMHSAALLIKTQLVRHALKWESVGARLSDTYCKMYKYNTCGKCIRIQSGKVF